MCCDPTPVCGNVLGGCEDVLLCSVYRAYAQVLLYRSSRANEFLSVQNINF